MVNKKYKLYSSILALGLTLALMATGVWAILQQSVGVSTTVSFTATSVKGTINGEVEGGYAGITTDYETAALGGSDALTGAEIVQFGTKYVFANITGTNSSWNGKEAYYENGATKEKVKSTATIASATSYTVSNKSYVSNFSPTSPTTPWSIEGMAFQPNSEGQTSAITLTLTIKNTGSSVIAVSFPNDLGQWSDAMTASGDNLSVTYQSKTTNLEVLPTAVEFSATNVTSIEIPSNETGTIVITLGIEDESSSISSALNIAFQLKLEKGVVWAGSVAPSFATGSGTGTTENDAYLIENAEQLTYLASAINAGTLTTTGKYFKLVQPITLNNYTQIFDEASGLVLVKNNVGILECCLGTGIKGTIYHTSTAGAMGTVYAPSSATDDNLTTGTIPADLKTWTPIGTSTYKFQGIFEGNGYTVTGLYINDTTGAQGLFGFVSGATIKDLTIANSYVRGETGIGGIAGVTYTSTLTNVYNTATVLGSFQVGGILGYSETVTIDSNINSGVIFNSDIYCGGIIGCNIQNSTITNSKNYGYVGAKGSLGGIIGYNETSTISNCFNTGKIAGVASQVGGIIGQTSGSNNSIDECYNTGLVSGGNQVGGIAGFTYYSTVTDCYNMGNVTGTTNSSNVGGIIGDINGTTNVDYCYNTAVIVGRGTVGGLVGYFNAGVVNNSYNTGDVSVTENAANLGGLVGMSMGNLYNSYNTGEVSGGSFVGGVMGFNMGTIINCFNENSVTATGNHVGGVTGHNETVKGIVRNSFNIGTVIGVTSYVGGVVGYKGGSSTIDYSYYLTGCATIGANIQLGVGDSSSTTSTNVGTTGFTSAEKTTLLNNLNDWVTANPTTPACRTWTLTGSTNGYPIFA